MATRGVSITIQFTAWNTSSNSSQTGDSANFTLKWVKDGTSGAPTNAASEIDATNAPGEYKITLTSAECNCDFGTLCGKSATAGVSILPKSVSFTTSPATRINLAAGGGAGTITLDSGASATDSLYKGCAVALLAGTGAGQAGRVVTAYVGSTKVATVTPAWTTQPDSTSIFALLPCSVDVQTIKTQTVTCDAGVTVAPFVGNATAALAVDASGRVGVQSGVTKNVALANFEFLMTSSSDHVAPATGLTVTATRSIDGAAFAGCANAVAEVGSGVYKISLAATDLNGSVVTLKFAATGADPRLFTVVTTP